MNLKVKILILGDQSVGKTTLLERLSGMAFQEHYCATIGVDYKHLDITYKNEEHKFILWDTSGQDKFKFILESYYNSVNGAIIMYDCNNVNSYNKAKDLIKEFREKKANNNLPIIVVSNKNDIQFNPLNSSHLEKIKEEFNVNTIEISLKNNTNVEEILPKLLQDFIDKIQKKILLPSKDRIIINFKNQKEFQIKDFDEERNNRCCIIM